MVRSIIILLIFCSFSVNRVESDTKNQCQIELKNASRQFWELRSDSDWPDRDSLNDVRNDIEKLLRDNSCKNVSLLKLGGDIEVSLSEVSVYSNNIGSVYSYANFDGLNSSERQEKMGNMLHVAANSAKPEIVAFLLGKGAPLEYENLTGRTPLLTSVTSIDNKSRAFRILIEAGADTLFIAKDQVSALRLAIVFDRIEIAKFLMKNGIYEKYPSDHKGILINSLKKRGSNRMKRLFENYGVAQ